MLCSHAMLSMHGIPSMLLTVDAPEQGRLYAVSALAAARRGHVRVQRASMCLDHERGSMRRTEVWTGPRGVQCADGASRDRRNRVNAPRLGLPRCVSS